MPWSINSTMPPQDPGLVDAAMLATGKALYLATAYESKCKYILQFLKLTDFLDKNPGCTHADALAHIAQTKMLGATLREMAAFTDAVTPAKATALDKAREGRNFIAHEGALGSICEIPSLAVAEHLPKLRTAVRDLAAGDGIVSAWCYIIQEKGSGGPSTSAYQDAVDAWAFGWMDEPDWQERLQAPDSRLRGTAGLRAFLELPPKDASG